MKRVVSFEEDWKPACEKLNEWLKKNPEIKLVDIRPVMSCKKPAILYAIVELEEKGKENKEKGEKEI